MSNNKQIKVLPLTTEQAKELLEKNVTSLGKVMTAYDAAKADKSVFGIYHEKTFNNKAEWWDAVYENRPEQIAEYKKQMVLVLA